MARTRLWSWRRGVDVLRMGTIRAHNRLFAVRQRLAALRLVSKDELHIPARYAAMLKLEAILMSELDVSDARRTPRSARVRQTA